MQLRPPVHMEGLIMANSTTCTGRYSNEDTGAVVTGHGGDHEVMLEHWVHDYGLDTWDFSIGPAESVTVTPPVTVTGTTATDSRKGGYDDDELCTWWLEEEMDALEGCLSALEPHSSIGKAYWTLRTAYLGFLDAAASFDAEPNHGNLRSLKLEAATIYVSSLEAVQTLLPSTPFYSLPRARRKLCHKGRMVLSRWLAEHEEYPFPSAAEKHELAIAANVPVDQVSTWFTNTRTRRGLTRQARSQKAQAR